MRRRRGLWTIVRCLASRNPRVIPAKAGTHELDLKKDRRRHFALSLKAAFIGPGFRRDDYRGIQSRFLPAVSGSQNRVTINAIATTPIVYQRPEKGSPVRATIYWLMKGRKPPK